MVYSFSTNAEQEAALTLAGKPTNQTNDMVFASTVNQALFNLDAGEAQALIQTIQQDNGLESLEAIAALPPNPNVQGKV